MNLLERVLTLLRANLHDVVEKANDPEKTLRQLQLDMRNQLVQVKTQVATAIAESHKLQKRSQEKKVEAEEWFTKAKLAVQQGNDPAARIALTHYNDLNKLAERYQQQQKDQEQFVATLRTVLRRLDAKITEVETTIDLMVTRKRNAQLQQRVFEMLQKSNDPRIRDRLARAQDIMIDREAQVQALQDLDQHDLDLHIKKSAGEQEIDHQLHLLKQKEKSSYASLNPENTKTPQTSSTSSSKRKRRTMKDQLHLPAEPSTSKDLDMEYLKKLLDIHHTNDF